MIVRQAFCHLSPLGRGRERSERVRGSRALCLNALHSPRPAASQPTSPLWGEVQHSSGHRMTARQTVRHLSPLGRGRERSERVRGSCLYERRNVWSIISSTPSRFSYTSRFVTRTIWNPNASRIWERSASRLISASVLCVAPSTSTINLPSIVTKSATYRPIGCWRRNFHRASRRPRSACQSRPSAFDWAARSLRALCLKRSIPLTRLLGSRPLPFGERCSTALGAA